MVERRQRLGRCPASMTNEVHVPRKQELAAALARETQRVAAAAAAAGRQPTDVQIVAVTKRFPASDVLLLAELGVRAVAENRHQEAMGKHAEVQEALVAGEGPVPQWHFIGQLQTNKAKAVARYADWVDTVDREPLVDALSAGAVAAERDINVLIQVSLDAGADPQVAGHRGGCAPAEVVELANAVAAAPRLHLRGVMGMAPLTGDPATAFALLADAAAAVRGRYPQADQMSAGMSGDLETAVAAGATQVRLGTALLGDRPSLR